MSRIKRHVAARYTKDDYNYVKEILSKDGETVELLMCTSGSTSLDSDYPDPCHGSKTFSIKSRKRIDDCIYAWIGMGNN